jgi:hypothetical protein
MPPVVSRHLTARFFHGDVVHYNVRNRDVGRRPEEPPQVPLPCRLARSRAACDPPICQSHSLGERPASQGGTIHSRRSDTGGLRGAMQLDFTGPYGCVPNPRWPHFVESPVARQPGIYLWTVPKGREFWINYIGKTDRHFVQRLRDEQIPYWLTGRDGCLDNEALARIVRKPITPPDDAALRETLRICCLFLAPCSCDPSTLLSIESILMYRAASHSPAAKRFLSRSCRRDRQTRYLHEELVINAPHGVTLIGLTP